MSQLEHKKGFANNGFNQFLDKSLLAQVYM